MSKHRIMMTWCTHFLRNSKEKNLLLEHRKHHQNWTEHSRYLRNLILSFKDVLQSTSSASKRELKFRFTHFKNSRQESTLFISIYITFVVLVGQSFDDFTTHIVAFARNWMFFFLWVEHLKIQDHSLSFNFSSTKRTLSSCSKDKKTLTPGSVESWIHGTTFQR